MKLTHYLDQDRTSVTSGIPSISSQFSSNILPPTPFLSCVSLSPFIFISPLLFPPLPPPPSWNTSTVFIQRAAHSDLHPPFLADG